jgi:hypothetical protein
MSSFGLPPNGVSEIHRMILHDLPPDRGTFLYLQYMYFLENWNKKKNPKLNCWGSGREVDVDD